MGTSRRLQRWVARTRMVKTKNQRLEIRGLKIHPGKTFGEPGCCDLDSLRRLLLDQWEFYRWAVCF